MDTIILIIVLITFIISLISLFITISISRTNNNATNTNEDNYQLIKLIEDKIRELETHLTTNINSQLDNSRRYSKELNDMNYRLLENKFEEISKSLRVERQNTAEMMASSNKQLENRLDTLTKSTEEHLRTMNSTSENKLTTLTNSLNTNFTDMRKELNLQVDKIRETVNERLDKTLNEQFEKSFKNVTSQMNDLQKSMGELQGISNQVGSLEKTLNGVKTRGILGEVQLRSIVEDALTPNQYEIECTTIPGSNDHVEIAIKLPNKSGNGFAYLPVDSKCHIDRYEELVDALNSNNPDSITSAKKHFRDAIREDAKKIADKYVSVPYTTPYAILFVPFEGMYSEIVNLNLMEELNKYHITVAGPYTFMAILSTLTNYFRSLAIESKSAEIERTLGQFKSEFEKYNIALDKVNKSLEAATNNLNTVRGTRTNRINRVLKDITTIDDAPLIPSDTNNYEDDYIEE